MPGPAPKRNARRTNARPDWRTPQADAWSNLGWTRVVARYASLVIESESGKVSVALLAEIRQLEDRLGLSPMAMRRLQWDVEPRELEAVAPTGNVTNLFG